MLKYIISYMLLSVFLWAETTSVVLKDDLNIYDKFEMGYSKDLIDSSNIEKIALQEQLFKTTSNKFAFGYNKDTLWIKIKLENISQKEDFIISINEHFYEKANLYYFDKSWKKIENGVFIPLDKRGIQTSTLSFDLKILPNTSQTIFLELKGKYSYFGNISIYQKEHFFKYQLFSIESFFIFLSGIIIIIIFFNLFLFIKLKENIYFYYMGYTFFALIYLINISGLLAYLDLQYYIYHLQLSASFAMGFLGLFSLEYLNIKKNLKYAYYFIMLILFLLLIFGCLLILFYTPWNKFLNHTITILNVTLIITALIIYIKGQHYVKYYLFGILLFFFTVVTFTMMLSGAIQYTFMSRYGYVFSMGIEVILFSLMLANRYNEIKNEQIKTQNQFIDLQNNQNKLLEEEVLKQTESLQNANKKLSNLVQERELLIKEVFHRVKNNFHIINAFLWFETQKEKNKNRFSELVNRIRSMSLIHEYLCNSEDLVNIDVQDYLDELIKTIVQTYNNTNIILNTKVDSIHIDLDQIMSLGIILNEIISNSIKHHPKTSPIILDILCLKKEHQIILKIKDNGKGFDLEQQSGFGLALIKDFSKKLPEGEYFFYKNEGTIFELKFKDTNDDKD